MCWIELLNWDEILITIKLKESREVLHGNWLLIIKDCEQLKTTMNTSNDLKQLQSNGNDSNEENNDG